MFATDKLVWHFIIQSKLFYKSLGPQLKTQRHIEMLNIWFISLEEGQLIRYKQLGDVNGSWIIVR